MNLDEIEDKEQFDSLQKDNDDFGFKVSVEFVEPSKAELTRISTKVLTDMP